MGSMKTLAAAIGVSAALVGTAAHAQGGKQAKIEIDTNVTYEQALKCYRYYDVAEQVANARSGKATGDALKDLQTRAAVDKALKSAWNKHIEDTKGKKSNKAVDEDLDRVAGSIVSDANAGLSGDKDAETRYEAVQTTCKTFEKVTPVG
ncbi:MAG: hypothetical protein GC155_12530 [Alphaproteobacteria bacterium]|nr:hypothetical protein [Alphaproteobacteria bacterium]